MTHLTMKTKRFMTYGVGRTHCNYSMSSQGCYGYYMSLIKWNLVIIESLWKN